MPCQDHSIEIQDLLFKAEQLAAQRGKACTHNIGHPFVARIGDDPQQFLDAFASDRCDDPKLGKMSADRIDHGGLLADEQMARAMQHQSALLLGRLGWHKPHIGPCHRFTNCFSVRHIVLLSLNVGLYVCRRHQPHGVAKCL